MNLFELFVKIGVDDQASGELETIGQKIGNGLKTAAKIGTAAVGAASAAVVALTTQAVNSFAEYEQLAGGAEKIFNEMSQTKILQDAQSAYKELGLSANQYLAVINDVGATFAATMGDEAGYEAAKTGLKAISDYASGTGKNVNELSQKFTLITRSTSSYQSIADQFSGILPATSKGFLDQAQAAGILSEKYTQLTEVPIEEYQAAVSQMLEQGVKELGLYNNTVDEAFGTLSGSLTMMKTSWSNLITGIADDNADFDLLIGNFVESVGATAENLLPRIEIALGGIGSLIQSVVPMLVGMLPGLVTEFVPSLIGAAGTIIENLVSALPSLISTLLPVVISGVAGLIGKLAQQLPVLIDEILGILPDLIEQLVDAVVELTPQLTEAVVGIVQAIADNLPEIIQAILDAIPLITESVNSAILENFPALLHAIIQIVLTIVRNLPQILQILVSQIGPIVSTIVQVIVENLPAFIAGIVQIVVEIVKALPGILASIGESILQIFEGIGTGLVNAWPKFKEGLKELWGKVEEWFDSMGEKAKEIGKNIIDGIKQGIKNAWNNLKEWFEGLFDDLIGIAKRILGIASPSKVFKSIGRFTAEGFGVGFGDEFASVRDDVESALDFSDVSVVVGSFDGGIDAGYGGVSIGSITINVDGAKYDDPQSLAEAIAYEIQNMTNRRSAVYA